MGAHKREKEKKTTSLSSQLKKPGNLKVKGENFFRDARKVKRLNMYKEGRAKHNAKGDVVKTATFQSTEIPDARIQPDRRWFNSTRVISQDALINFREAMKDKKDDPYQFILRKNKLPMSLLEEKTEIPTVKVVETESFEHTFGPKSQRKKNALQVSSLEELATSTEDDLKRYEDKVEEDDFNSQELDDGVSILAKEAIFHKGTSKRIWNELYKVIDSSDVLIHVLDARDPLGTRCTAVEDYIKKEASHKHLFFVLNKADLVPNSVAVSILLFFSQFLILNPFTFTHR